MESQQMIKGLLSDVLNKNLYESITSEKLAQQNNYFEVVSNKYPLKPFVDLDGSFDNGITKEDFLAIDLKILERLKTLDNVSIMTSSHYEALKMERVCQKMKKTLIVKLSYRLVWTNEYVENIKIMKLVVEDTKSKILQELLEDILPLTMKSAQNSLNIDTSVYRNGVGKIRCANAYKYPEQKERVNKIIKGTIEDSIINIKDNEINNLQLIEPQKALEQKQKQKIKENKTIEKKQKEETKTIEKETKKSAKERKEEAHAAEKEEIKQEKASEKLKAKQEFSQTEIEELLKVMGNKADWDRWNTVGLVLHDNSYDFKLFKDWSKKSKKNDEDVTKEHWSKYPEPTGDWVVFSLLKYAKADNPEGYADWCKKYNKPHIASVLKQGAKLFDEEYSAEIMKNLRYSESQWYSCSLKTNLWSIDERVESSILDFILTELRKNNNEGLMKKFEASSFLVLLINCLKKSLCDDEFYKKIETPQDHIAFKNGLYNLKTKAFQQGFKAENYIAKTLAYDFDPAFKSNTIIKKEIEESLIKLLSNSKEDYNYMMRVLGYALTGRASEQQQFYSCIGQKGGNGKTTLFEILGKIFDIYLKKVTPKCFEQDYNKAHKDLDGVQGSRFLISEEFKKGSKLNEQLVKVFRDGLTSANEVMFGTSKIIKITSKLFFTSNATLTFDADGGMNRGYRQINFNSRFVDCLETSVYKHEKLCFQADKTMTTNYNEPEYRNEILHLFLEFANQYYKNGLITPAKIIEESETTCALQGDTFMCFFEDNYVIKKEGRVFRRDFETHFFNETKKLMDLKTAKDELVRISDTIVYDRNKKGTGIDDEKRGCFYGFERKPQKAEPILNQDC